MARKRRYKTRYKKAVTSVVGGVLVLIFAALMLYVPSFEGYMRQILGVDPVVEIPYVDSDSDVSVHFIDVGQGSATLLESGGEFALIDAGLAEYADVVVAYMKAAGVSSLRYMIMSHPHSDHIGGMTKVLDEFYVEEMILPKLDLAPLPTTSTFENLLNAMVEKDVFTTEVSENAMYPLGDASITVVHTGVSTEDNYNLLSSGFLFEAQGMRFLHTGDGEKENEKMMLNDAANIKADVFMAAHHGSSTSNEEEFVGAVSPQIVVVSCGEDNSYGHPHREPLAVFESVNATILRTDLDGHVVLKPDGHGGVTYATQGKAA